MAKKSRPLEMEEAAELPELWAIGMQKIPDSAFYLVYRLSSKGAIEILTPKRHGIDAGESKQSAMGRLQSQIRREHAGTGLRLRDLKTVEAAG